MSVLPSEMTTERASARKQGQGPGQGQEQGNGEWWGLRKALDDMQDGVHQQQLATASSASGEIAAGASHLNTDFVEGAEIEFWKLEDPGENACGSKEEAEEEEEEEELEEEEVEEEHFTRVGPGTSLRIVAVVDTIHVMFTDRTHTGTVQCSTVELHFELTTSTSRFKSGSGQWAVGSGQWAWAEWQIRKVEAGRGGEAMQCNAVQARGKRGEVRRDAMIRSIRSIRSIRFRGPPAAQPQCTLATDDAVSIACPRHVSPSHMRDVGNRMLCDREIIPETRAAGPYEHGPRREGPEREKTRTRVGPALVALSHGHVPAEAGLGGA
ncbi:hypothetical protein MBM_06223 [Drepanopeziza brunnea f. sp. 'multigermtubi' MB_m1]|uniref:Uncharacterized protein n=1 Tax=Marssonina brunnea f. sp. multigermtubi (strain MB_m1) TaxID=1072389 RepID=K1WDW1_MARBU|nr:uncharacterized protein MBM_06223 [Drepanopeziza brunnea f. sp. 'multigermtubi' MB_m1]EKD15595.1 hypothetical protein MBM_06223 [Drepanopeziza brunnea f. sp. 'multigermtubi' MB_m1]